MDSKSWFVSMYPHRLKFYIKLIRKALLWNKQGLKPIAIVDIDVVYNFMVIDQFIYFASDG